MNSIKKILKKIYGKNVFYQNNTIYKSKTILGFSFTSEIGKISQGVNNTDKHVHFHWQDAFNKYFKEENIKEKIETLKLDMDDISCEYIDKFMELSAFWGKEYTHDHWTNYDKKLFKEMEALDFKQPFPELLVINPFLISNIYGLKDLPKDVFDSIDGKDIIDAGGLNGDTAIMFEKYFPTSNITVFEPLSVNVNIINNIIEKGNLKNIVPIRKGLGDKEETIEISFNDTEMADIVTIDGTFSGQNVGLIKIDTEGFETQIISGASELIKNQKPILAIAIYHTPEDFFDMKDKLQKLNPDYRFMIRRSEQVIATADLVLIAVKPPFFGPS